MTQVVLAALFTARHGCGAALEAEAARIVGPTRAEPGCLRYELHRDPGNPGVIAYLETWADAGALEAHRRSPHVQAWRAAAADLIASRDVRTLEPLGMPGPMAAGPLAVLAFVTARPGCEAALAAELGSMVPPTRLEPGCLRYDLHRDPANPASLAFLESWESRGALAAHMATPAFRASRDRQKDLVEAVEIHVLEPV
ncbi:putative quinol monooxygenase [Geothrix sp. 21YS21S-2]|uniref:putative quinol monooxygenase n=1 Tax=Geothrix sp. 21YS21S-2 TaxID=3068893 RepID=UPI0027B9B96B|nr:putative quinol monooxygenase [Geothrix sp. 21YS21S-2]